MSLPPVGFSGSSSWSAQVASSPSELLNNALCALKGDNPTQADAFVRQLPSDIASRLFFLAWEASGSPMDMGCRFGEEAFFGQNQRPLDVNAKKALLEKVIREQSGSSSSGSPSASPADSGSSPGFPPPGLISGLLSGLGSILTGKRPTNAAGERPVASAPLSSRLQFALQIHRSTNLAPSLVDIISDYAIARLGEEELLQCFDDLEPLYKALNWLKKDPANYRDRGANFCEEQAKFRIQKLRPEVANRIYHLAWVESGSPMNVGNRFGEEVFLGQNRHVLAGDRKRDILKRVIGEQINTHAPEGLPSSSVGLSSWLTSAPGYSAGDLSILPLRTGSLSQIRNTTRLSEPLVKMIHMYAIDCFGAEEWRRYFKVNVNCFSRAPELPQEFYDFWYACDPFDCTQMVCDTHIPPVLRPVYVEFSGQQGEYTTGSLGKIVRRCSTSLLSRPGLSRELPFRSSSHAAWLVMRKGVIGRNRGFHKMQNFTGFLNIGTHAGYQIERSALDISTILFARYAATGERHLGDASGAEGCLTMSYTSEKLEIKRGTTSAILLQENGTTYDVLLGGFSSGARLNVGLGDRMVDSTFGTYPIYKDCCVENGTVFLRQF